MDKQLSDFTVYYYLILDELQYGMKAWKVDNPFPSICL